MARYEHTRESVWNRKPASKALAELLEAVEVSCDPSAIDSVKMKLQEFEDLCWYEGYCAGRDDSSL